MADIELVIKIPQKTNERIRSIYGHNKCTGLWDEDRDIVVTAIYNGTPLDDVKAEMQRLADEPWNMTVSSASQGLEDAIEILDSIGEAKGEKE